jgi:hypothetical protein
VLGHPFDGHRELFSAAGGCAVRSSGGQEKAFGFDFSNQLEGIRGAID